ncbi:MAG TPA: TIGR03885 family FMN-dependent LLM class oxidoreductase [Candidatus Limnocylindrales bacterium]|nr:TIGR03885 family FMN-dependent LLM class oxidoreductase [Candidatus Limnocylindrales bacterium]
MPLIGYHASHEQFSPSELLQYVQAAEQAGFDGAMCSDHFHPWLPSQAHSAFAWSWLGAALQATNLSFGVVNAPGYRYHPAIIAQAAATLAYMYPGRFWMAVGSGEALNEAITGERWPYKQERNARLRESVEIMRALWRGETVTHHGLVRVEEAKLYTRPAEPPMIFAAAVSEQTARWAGEWADGLITIAAPPEEAAKVADAFRERAPDKPLLMQVQVAWADSDDKAVNLARERWPIVAISGDVLWDLRQPEHFQAAIENADPSVYRENMLATSSIDEIVERMSRYVEIGFERLYLHQVGPDQHRFIETFAERVLPQVRESSAGAQQPTRLL